MAILLVLAAVAAPAAAADDPIHPEGATVKLLLLRQKSVQEELKVSEDLKKKIMDFTEKQAEAFVATRKLPAAEQKQKHEEMQKENEKFIKDSLSAAQVKRLDQITMQFAALHHLLKPEHARELKLSDEQITKLKDLQKDARKGFEEILTSKGEGRTEKLAKLRMEMREKIIAILNDDQKEKVRELAGPQFTGDIVIED
jgi:Spy/CpxP family protein refolding chaperone